MGYEAQTCPYALATGGIAGQGRRSGRPGTTGRPLENEGRTRMALPEGKTQCNEGFGDALLPQHIPEVLSFLWLLTRARRGTKTLRARISLVVLKNHPRKRHAGRSRIIMQDRLSAGDHDASWRIEDTLAKDVLHGGSPPPCGHGSTPGRHTIGDDYARRGIPHARAPAPHAPPLPRRLQGDMAPV